MDAFGTVTIWLSYGYPTNLQLHHGLESLPHGYPGIYCGYLRVTPTVLYPAYPMVTSYCQTVSYTYPMAALPTGYPTLWIPYTMAAIPYGYLLPIR